MALISLAVIILQTTSWPFCKPSDLGDHHALCGSASVPVPGIPQGGFESSQGNRADMMFNAFRVHLSHVVRDA